MLAEERQQMIMKQLEKARVVKLQDLVQSLHASESTIRRDLQELEFRHLLRRVHGGASLLQLRSTEPDMETKTAENMQQKRSIARLAASLVKEHECIYLDAGTTTLEMIPYIKGGNVTVVTNGPSHAEMLAERMIACYLIGGKMKRSTKAVIGSMANRNLDLFRFDRAFLGANGIDATMGYTTPDPEEASLKRHAKELSAQTYVVADSSKFFEVSFSKMFDLREAAIITDELPDSAGPLAEITKICCPSDENVDLQP